MNQSIPSDAIHSLNLIKHAISEAAGKLKKACDGKCSSCPCSGSDTDEASHEHQDEEGEHRGNARYK